MFKIVKQKNMCSQSSSKLVTVHKVDLELGESEECTYNNSEFSLEFTASLLKSSDFHHIHLMAYRPPNVVCGNGTNE